MSDLNSVNLVGRMAKDPELKQSKAGKPYCKFSIVVNDYNTQTKENEGSFFNCIVFGKSAETVNKYFHKGDPAGVTGKLTQNRWVDDNGKKRSSVEIIALTVSFIPQKSSKKKDSGDYSGGYSYGDLDEGGLLGSYAPNEDDDVPF